MQCSFLRHAFVFVISDIKTGKTISVFTADYNAIPVFLGTRIDSYGILIDFLLPFARIVAPAKLERKCSPRCLRPSGAQPLSR